MSPARRSDVASGKRDRWVELVPITDSVGTSGFPVETDASDPNRIGLWARKEDVSGRERIAMAQEAAPFDTIWDLPYSRAFDPDIVDVSKAFALYHKGRRYDIVNAAIIGRAEGVELLTTATQG